MKNYEQRRGRGGSGGRKMLRGGSCREINPFFQPKLSPKLISQHFFAQLPSPILMFLFFIPSAIDLNLIFLVKNRIHISYPCIPNSLAFSLSRRISTFRSPDTLKILRRTEKCEKCAWDILCHQVCHGGELYRL